MLTNIQLIRHFYFEENEAFNLGFTREADFRSPLYDPECEDVVNADLQELSSRYGQRFTELSYWIGQWYRRFGRVTGWYRNPVIDEAFTQGFDYGVANPSYDSLPTDCEDTIPYSRVWVHGWELGLLLGKMKEIWPYIGNAGLV